jgi:hypothetical protein
MARPRQRVRLEDEHPGKHRQRDRYLHEEYRTQPAPGWSAPEEFKEYTDAHQLDPQQLYWAWLKNRDLAVTIGGPPDRICWKFRQEYPATASEAFQMSGEESFIPVDRVAKARRGQVSSFGALILGVDPARGGKDKTGLIDRQGRRLGANCKERIDSDDLMHIVGVIVRKINELRPKGLKPWNLIATPTGGQRCGIVNGSGTTTLPACRYRMTTCFSGMNAQLLSARAPRNLIPLGV